MGGAYQTVILRIAAMLTLLVCWACTGIASAQGGRQVTLVLSDSTPLYLETAAAFRRELEKIGPAWRLTVQTLTERRPGDGEDLIVAIGLRALSTVWLEAGATPVWSILVPRQGYEELVAMRLGGGQRRAPSALYLGQPLTRHFDLILAALPATRKVGVLLGPSSLAQEGALRQAAAASGVEVVYLPVRSVGEVVPSLDKLRGRVDVLLLLPDPVVVDRGTLAALMLTSYEQRLPIAAYSLPLLQAGAMLALYASPERTGEEAARLLNASQTGNELALPRSTYAVGFDVAVNRSVASSLDIPLPGVEALRQRMLKRGGR